MSDREGLAVFFAVFLVLVLALAFMELNSLNREMGEAKAHITSLDKQIDRIEQRESR